MKLALCSAAAISIFFAAGCSVGESTTEADTVAPAEAPAGIAPAGSSATKLGNEKVVPAIRVAPPRKTVPAVKDVPPFVGGLPIDNASSSDEAPAVEER
jgi:hypothetical protein